MKKFFGANDRWFLGGVLIALVIIATVSYANITLAYSIQQTGSRPNLALSGQNSPSGEAIIQSQEVRLDHNYFANNGQLTGLRVTSAGLSLAEGETSGLYESGVIDSPLPFTTDIVPLWGANLPDGTALDLETRLSFDGGDSWSEWLKSPVAFYPVRDNLFSGNLIWVGNDQSAFQFRVTLSSVQFDVSPTVSQIILAFSDTSQGPTGAEIAEKTGVVTTATDTCPVDKPAIASRTDWGNPEGQNSPRRPPTYHPISHIIIHQTETPNDTAPYQDFAGWVRSIWNFHANILGWGDVGYNFLIDPDGVIYEGRAGGDDVVGIHDGFNQGSMGLGLLGCYGNCDDPHLNEAEPSQSMLASTEHLIAWKLGQNGIDPLASGAYAGLNEVPVIAGGRDVTMTSSPGDNLYNKLPDLRVSVAEKVNCQPTTPTPVPNLPVCQIQDITFDKEQYLVNDTISLAIRLMDQNDNPLPGALVKVDVEKPEVNTQEASGFNLIDHAGEYDGNFSDTDIAGEYLFTINASDPTGELFAACSAQAAVLVNPEPPTNDPPVANDDNATTAQNMPVTIDVAANDTDPDGNLDPNTVTVVSIPANGSASIPGPGQITYTPITDFTGTDSFIYQICDTVSACDTATVFVTVTAITPTDTPTATPTMPTLTPTPTGTPTPTETPVPVNSPPVANDDSTSTAQNTPVTFNVAANDTDPDGNLDLNTVAVVSQPVNGSATDAGSGQITYTPNTDFTGTDSFTYQICDNAGACDTATVTVTVTSITGTPVVSVTPALLQLGLDETGVTAVEVTNISDLYGVDLELNYDPDLVEVVDADPSQDGTQVGLGAVFEGVDIFVVENKASNGVINFTASRLAPAPAFEGTGSIIEITWRGKSQGQTEINLNQVKLSTPDGISLMAEHQNGMLEITDTQPVITLQGKVELQGNSDSSSVTITSGDHQAQPGPDGTFEVVLDSTASYQLTLTAPGYLSARAEEEVTAGSTTIDIGSVTLLAGDTNNDDQINILDLAYLGARYGSIDPSADFNVDGIVDIFDLVIAADNYGQQGPLINW